MLQPDADILEKAVETAGITAWMGFATGLIGPYICLWIFTKLITPLIHYFDFSFNPYGINSGFFWISGILFAMLAGGIFGAIKGNTFHKERCLSGIIIVVGGAIGSGLSAVVSSFCAMLPMMGGQS